MIIKNKERGNRNGSRKKWKGEKTRENKFIMKSKMIISKIEDYHFFLIEEKYHEYY